MKKKMYLLLALMLIGMKALSEEKIIEKVSDNKSKETEIEISLDNETVTSTNGIDIVYGPNRFKVFDIRRDTAANRMYIDGDFTLDSYQPTGDIRIESQNGVALLDGTKAVFDTTFGYMEVGKVTGAEAPNDRVYFGGERAKFDNGVVLLKNAWFTTDPKVNTNRDLTDLGYYIRSKKIKIEPDKQVTFTGSDLFIQDFDVMPFTLPWYRFNIRQGSEVPLFPVWGDEEDYGWTISTGVLYEGMNGKYRGGFAPKFGDQIGLLAGRWENWYDTGEYGESRLNITDLLLYKKDKNKINSETGRYEPSHDDRWDIEYTHKYEGDYGHFDFGLQSLTYNMNDTLKDIIEDYDAQGRFHNGKGGLGEIPSMGDHSNFYTLDTSLTGLGERKDITIDAKVKLTDDKKGYQYIVNDQIDDLGYDSQVDNDLFSNISVTKDNEDYKISGYYNYLYDMDPGSNPNDLQSRAEDFGFGFEDKNRKISLKYDEKNGDLYRKLNSWERNPDLSKLKTTDKYGLTADYVPWTVAMYDIYDSRNFGAVFGEYKLTDNLSFKTGYDYTFSEKELNLENDPMRKNIFGEKSRWSQYNRFENITYEKIEEQRAFVDLYTGLVNFTFAGGRREETVHTREGINSDLESRKFKNESDFYEFGLNKNNIDLGYLGEIDIFGNIRQDKYKSGINNGVATEDNDKTTRYQAGLNHRITLLDNSGNADRWADLGLKNEFRFFYEDYKYDGNSKQEFGRLINKDNRYTYGDTVNFEFGNTETVYTGEYTLKERPENDEKSGEIFKNKVDFLIDGDKALSAYYNSDERYSDDYDGTFGNKYNNDLGTKDYGFNIYSGNHEFYYKNQSIDFDDFNFKPFEKITGKGLSEEIRENVFGYTYTFGENRLNFEYTQGKDKVNATNIDVLDIDNRTYAVTYINGGEIEHSYSVKYEDYQGNYRTLEYDKTNNWYKYSKDFHTNYNSNVITLRYGFKDKRLSEEELAKYAEREYGKEAGELTPQDISNIRSILENRNSLGFNLNSVMNNRVNFGDYRRSFDIRLTLESKDDRRDEENYWNSLSKIEAAVFYSQNRIGLGYTFTQEADYDDPILANKQWKVTEREHEFSFHAKIGRPSEGWRLKSYVQFYDSKDTPYGDGSGRRFFDEAGVEIGKEMGYYEWSLAYVREYSIATRDYEWKTALQFTLLTFPDKRLFAVGAKGDSKPDSKAKPDIHVFSGLKIEDELGKD